MSRKCSLTATVFRFRRAVERHAITAPEDDILRGFPMGTCKHASVLLARFLDAEGFAPAALIANGHRDERDGVRGFQTHAWLKVEGYHVDITADQFVDAPAEVIVARQSPFLRRFRGAVAYPGAATMPWRAEHEARLVSAYAAVLSRIERAQP